MRARSVIGLVFAAPLMGWAIVGPGAPADAQEGPRRLLAGGRDRPRADDERRHGDGGSMNQRAFRRALRYGFGRAILHLQRHDAARYRDDILGGCLHDWT